MDRPRVIMILVESLDGVIADNSDELVDWSSKEDKKHFFKSTKDIGIVISGSNSFDTIPKPWKDREYIVLTSNPDKYKDKFPGYNNLHFIKADDPNKVLEKVEELGFDEVALIGGSSVNTFFAKAGLIDELWITVEPIIFGHGLSLFTDKLRMDLELKSFENLNDDTILLKYTVQK